MSVGGQPRKFLIGLQTVLWAGYFVGAGLLIVVAALRAGAPSLYPSLENLGDPKDALGLGIAGHIVHLPLLFLTVFGGAATAIAALAGMGMLTLSPADRTRWLYISTALTLACAGVHLSPLGRQISVWMMD